MSEKLLAVVGVVTLLLVGATGALLTGFGPAPGGDSRSDVEQFPTETESADSRSGDGGSDGRLGGHHDGDGDAAVHVQHRRHRGVRRHLPRRHSTLTNQQDTTAEDVTMYTRIFAGQGTDGDQVWEGSEDVGTLEAGGSDTVTRRLELTVGDAFAIDQEDGWITIQTAVKTADVTVTFTDQRQVA